MSISKQFKGAPGLTEIELLTTTTIIFDFDTHFYSSFIIDMIELEFC